MKISTDEIILKRAIQIYLRDSSQENYQKLKNLVFGEQKEHDNLFEVLAEISCAKKNHDIIFW